MLLFSEDVFRTIRSVAPRQVIAPYLPVPRVRSIDDARALLSRFDVDGVAAHQVIASELGRSGLSGRQLIEAAAQAIVAGSLVVACQLSAKAKLVFDDRRPSGRRTGAVCFPNQAAAEDFIGSLTDRSDALAALRQALGHPHRQYWLPDSRSDPVSTEHIAFLLLSQRLIMVPLAYSDRVFALLWQLPWVGRTIDGGATPAPDPSSPDPSSPGRPSLGRPSIDRRRPAGADEYHWVEIELVDSNDDPVPGEAYIVTLPTGKEVKGLLDADGWARVDYPGSAGACQVSFPNLDKAEWQQHQASPLASRHFA